MVSCLRGPALSPRGPPLSRELRGGGAQASCRNGHPGGRGGVPVPSSSDWSRLGSAEGSAKAAKRWQKK
ncbi:Hypothetical predicted protein [Marmota monax]|uniref:Uncharacterized protein n=1 Tax=Marmota monax TaxID=9995 RepID=A0A5E4AXL7_MARMO|nr:hypothetical protein GHT09_010059 [Marmota monax]VTJ61279.1 Hypothetical predicted protein [Marmota monax]